MTDKYTSLFTFDHSASINLGDTLTIKVYKHDTKGLLLQEPFVGITINDSVPFDANQVIKACRDFAERHDIYLSD